MSVPVLSRTPTRVQALSIPTAGATSLPSECVSTYPCANLSEGHAASSTTSRASFLNSSPATYSSLVDPYVVKSPFTRCGGHLFYDIAASTSERKEKVGSLVILNAKKTGDNCWVYKSKKGYAVHHEWINRQFQLVQVSPVSKLSNSSLVRILIKDDEKARQSLVREQQWPLSYDVDMVVVLGEHPTPFCEDFRTSGIQFATYTEAVSLLELQIQPLLSTFLNPGINATVVEITTEQTQECTSFLWGKELIEENLIYQILHKLVQQISHNASYRTTIDQFNVQKLFRCSNSTRSLQASSLFGNGANSESVAPLRILLGNCLFVSLDPDVPLLLDGLEDLAELVVSQSPEGSPEVQQATFINLRHTSHVLEFLTIIKTAQQKLRNDIPFAILVSLFCDTCRHPLDSRNSQLCRLVFADINLSHLQDVKLSETLRHLNTSLYHTRHTVSPFSLFEDMIHGSCRTLFINIISSDSRPDALELSATAYTVMNFPRPVPLYETGTVALYLSKWDRAIIRAFRENRGHGEQRPMCVFSGNQLTSVGEILTGKRLKLQLSWSFFEQCGTETEAVSRGRLLLANATKATCTFWDADFDTYGPPAISTLSPQSSVRDISVERLNISAQ